MLLSDSGTDAGCLLGWGGNAVGWRDFERAWLSRSPLSSLTGQPVSGEGDRHSDLASVRQLLFYSFLWHGKIREKKKKKN